MPEWPEVTVVICTYNREAEIRKTIDSLVTNLRYPASKIHFHIADDGSSEGYAQAAARYCHDAWGEAWGHSVPATATVTPRKGWGVNVNTALQYMITDYVYFTEDDYVLKRPLNLCSYVAAMEVAPALGMIRFGIAGHGVTCHLNEIDIKTWMPEYEENDSNQGYNGTGKMNMWVLDKDFSSGPFAFYLYSNRPHLKHRRFHEAYGYYEEGLTLGNTEHAMNHRLRQGPALPYIACPANWTLWHYDHIGVSRQGTSEDVHAS